MRIRVTAEYIYDADPEIYGTHNPWEVVRMDLPHAEELIAVAIEEGEQIDYTVVPADLNKISAVPPEWYNRPERSVCFSVKPLDAILDESSRFRN